MNSQFCFVARKKFSHVSLLHVVHHGIMPLSVWPGLKFMPGGHASFFGLLNTFVHIFMYAYYMLSAMGPKYQKYVWWKQHMTTLQMVQFVGIMVHAFQLVTNLLLMTKIVIIFLRFQSKFQCFILSLKNFCKDPGYFELICSGIFILFLNSILSSSTTTVTSPGSSATSSVPTQSCFSSSSRSSTFRPTSCQSQN